MSRVRIIIIAVSIIFFFAALGIYFTAQDGAQENQQNQNQQSSDLGFVKEDEVQKESASPEYFESFGVNKLKVTTYGGSEDIKTIVQGKNEYALIRNPKEIGDIDFASSNEFGEFYFAEDNGQKISFIDGTPEGKFGYDDKGEVSGTLIRERNSTTEYYASYPSQELARRSGFAPFRDDGTTNNYLKTKYLKITNLNTNRQVIVEIDSRNPVQDTLFISEATRKGLGIDNGALGSFSLEIVEKENNTLGVVRL